MFVWKVRQIAQSRGIMSASQLAERAKIAEGTAVSLWHARPLQITLPVLAKICNALSCTPNDILFYNNDENAPGNEKPLLVAA